MPTRSSRKSSDDPLSLAVRPPDDETPEQREKRVLEEKEAQRISDEIDAQLRKEERAAVAEMRSTRRPVRVLLLGQSESGKSTTLKNFQMVWAPQSWKEERASWRSVVLFNIVISTFHILSSLFTPPSPTDESPPQEEPQIDLDLDALYTDISHAHDILKRRLGAGTDEPGDYRTGSDSLSDPKHEFFVRPNISWKDRLIRMKKRRSTLDIRPSMDISRDSSLDERDEAREILVARKADIQQLWLDPGIQELLSRRGVKLEETPGFFMNDLDRILVDGYEPSDDDVVRARLRTMGVQEHKFIFETGSETGREWRIYDVGGSRPQRASWFSYFDNVDAIIFLVPVNCFDEVLDEDHGVNRLQDSFELWKAICRSPLLSKVQLILFLNKVDLLERKLESGIHFAHYIPTFGSRQNTQDSVCRYLRNQFREIQKRYSPDRSFSAWFTCATDTKATEKTLGTVRHGIIKEHFANAALV